MVHKEYAGFDTMGGFNVAVPDSSSYRGRTLLDVVGIRGRKTNLRVISVKIPGWKQGQTVNLSAACIPEWLKGSLKVGDMLLARVNLGANKAKGLKPTEFDLAPRPLREEEF